MLVAALSVAQSVCNATAWVLVVAAAATTVSAAVTAPMSLASVLASAATVGASWVLNAFTVVGRSVRACCAAVTSIPAVVAAVRAAVTAAV